MAEITSRAAYVKFRKKMHLASQQNSDEDDRNKDKESCRNAMHEMMKEFAEENYTSRRRDDRYYRKSFGRG